MLKRLDLLLPALLDALTAPSERVAVEALSVQASIAADEAHFRPLMQQLLNRLPPALTCRLVRCELFCGPGAVFQVWSSLLQPVRDLHSMEHSLLDASTLHSSWLACSGAPKHSLGPAAPNGASLVYGCHPGVGGARRFRGRTGAGLLQRRGSLIVRRLARLLGPRQVLCALAAALEEEADLRFACALVQALNLILLTAPEVGCSS